MTTLSTKLDALLARRAQDYIDEFDDFMTTITAAQNGVGAGLVGTSTTSATIGAGAQSLTVQADKNFAAGQYVIAYQTSAPANFMIGVASAYSGDTGVLAFTVASGDTGGSGTITDWTVAVSGRRGATGATGGITGGTLTGSIDADGYDITDIDNLTAASATVTTLAATTAAVTDLTVSGLTTIAQAGENAEGNATNVTGDVILQATGEPVQRHTLTGDVTYLVAGAPTPGHGWQVEVRPTQDGTGGRAVTILPANLLTYSEQFDNAAWTKGETTVSANAVASPSGATTADAIIPSTNSAFHTASQSVTVSSGATVAVTAYAKANGYNGLQLRCGNTAETAAFQAIVNLSTGAVASSSAYGTGATLMSASIVDVGGGWYRVVVVGAVASTTTYKVILYVDPDTTVAAFAGNGTSGVYVWGAQLVAGSSPLGYAAVGATRAGQVVWRAAADEIDFAGQAAAAASRILISYGSDGEILVDDVSLVS